MRHEWPEFWWVAVVLCILGMTGEAIAAARGAGIVAFVCAVPLAWVALGFWRAR